MATITGNKIEYTTGVTTYGRCQLNYEVSGLSSSSNSVTVSGLRADFIYDGGTSNTMVERSSSLKVYINGAEAGSWGTHTYTCDGDYHRYSLYLSDFVVYNPNQSGAGFSFSISVSCGVKIKTSVTTLKSGTSSASTTVNVAGVARASVLNIGGLTNNAVDVDGTITISKTQYISNATHSLSYSFLSTSGTPTEGSWPIPASFEPLMTAVSSASCSITLTTYVNGSSIGSSTKTFTINIPSTYVPVITLGTLTKNNAYNGELIAGYSSFSQAYALSVTPSGNSATIDSVSATITNNVTVASCTTTATSSNTLPASATDYSVSLTLVVTDSRGRTATEVVAVGNAKAFIPPVVGVNSVSRCLSDGTDDPSGTYAFIKVTAFSSYAINSVSCTANGTSYPLTLVSGYYQGIVGGGTLIVTNQYTLTVAVIDQFMSDFSLPAVTVSVTLSTMALPLSLYDDGSDYGVTLGRVADGPDFHVYMDTVLHGTLSGTHVGDQVTFELNGTTLNIVDVS